MGDRDFGYIWLVVAFTAGIFLLIVLGAIALFILGILIIEVGELFKDIQPSPAIAPIAYGLLFSFMLALSLSLSTWARDCERKEIDDQGIAQKALIDEMEKEMDHES